MHKRDRYSSTAHTTSPICFSQNTRCISEAHVSLPTNVPETLGACNFDGSKFKECLLTRRTALRILDTKCVSTKTTQHFHLQTAYPILTDFLATHPRTINLKSSSINPCRRTSRILAPRPQLPPASPPILLCRRIPDCAVTPLRQCFHQDCSYSVP